MRVILGRELPGQLLQDMFAVMTFPGGYLEYLKKTSGEEQPEIPTSANLYGNNRSEAIEKHLTRWCRKEFPKSLREQDPDFVSEMEVYYRRLVGYIEDYCSKAAGHPSISYCKLPPWTHPDHLYIDASEHEWISKKSAKLTSWGQKEYMRGFLLYELTCLLHCPGSFYDTAHHYDGIINPAREPPPDPHPRTTALFREIDPEPFPPFWEPYFLFCFCFVKGDVFEDHDYIMIRNVRQYVGTLCGALIFQQRLPENSRCVEHHQAYPVILGFLCEKKDCIMENSRLQCSMAVNGLRVLDNILRGESSEALRSFRRFTAEVGHRHASHESRFGN